MNVFKAALISSLIVIVFAITFHYYNVAPHKWNLVAAWLPVYISPLWGAAGLSWFSERGKE